MSVELYEMAHSPFCIPIAQALTALGVRFERREVPNWDRSRVIQLTHGQYYQVPVLVHDGRVLFESAPDSQDVARYVDSTFAGGRLFPADKAGWQALLLRYLENDVEDVTFKLVDPPYVDAIPRLEDRVHVIRHKERKFGRGCVEEWRRHRTTLREQAERLLQPFEQILGSQAFVLGDRPVYVDFALEGILGNLTYRDYNQLSENQRVLRAWRERLAAYRF